MIRILIVDDHPYLVDKLASLFDENQDIDVVGTSTSGIEAMNLLRKLTVDVVVLDILMPDMNGIECCKIIKKDFPDVKVIALTGEMNTKILYNMWDQKADGILIKACGLEELTSSIISVAKGQKVIGQNVPHFFDERDKNQPSIPKLTETEIEVLKLLAEGMTRQEAADKMNRSMYAIEFHCKNIFKKFNSNRIHSIVAEARRARIIY